MRYVRYEFWKLFAKHTKPGWQPVQDNELLALPVQSCMTYSGYGAGDDEIVWTAGRAFRVLFGTADRIRQSWLMLCGMSRPIGASRTFGKSGTL